MDFAQHVKSSVDIIGVLGEYVRLRKQGPDRFVGLCPFHTEKTPSFSVHQGLQIYKCFGCGKGGDVFSFLMELQGLSFYESLKMLAEQHGIPLPRRQFGELSGEESNRRAALLRMHEIAQEIFQKQLQGSEGAHALAYTKQRSLSAEVVAEFGLGYAAARSRLIDRFHREGLQDKHLEESGLVSKSREGTGFYERFRDRLTFPITNENGRIVAYGARALAEEQQPKYLNSAETPIYKKSSILYNLHRAKVAMRKENRVVLVEGYMDVIGVHAAGFPAVVATCGTSLTSEQVRALRRHVEVVIINFDSDTAGKNAAQRSIELLLQEGLSVRVLTLPDGMDPAEFCEKRGPQAYGENLEKAPDYYIWLADRAREQFDMHTSDGRVAAFRFLMPSVHLIPDKLKRASLADELANHLAIPAGLVLEQFRRAATERQSSPLAAPPTDPFSAGESLLLKLFMKSLEARREMLSGVAEIAASESLPSAKIFQALGVVELSEEPFQYTAVEGRLEDNERKLLSKIVFEEDGHSGSLDDGRQAYGALRMRSWERRYRAVRRQIAEAEKAGNRSEALRFLQLKTKLEKERRDNILIAEQVEEIV
jgi:DNA primase